MPKSRKKPRSSPRTSSESRNPSGESRTAEAATVFWTVSVTTLTLCDIAAALAQLYAKGRPEARGMAALGDLLLLAGAAIGVLSLAMVPIVLRLRRVPPPRGLVVFAVCVAAAPILAVALRIVQTP